jgi:threonine dehydrogenase-like Zn-dependent dehydrogenase
LAWTETAVVLKSGRITVLREAIRARRKGGTVSVIGVHGGSVDKFPMGAVMNKALTSRGGQQHGQRCAERRSVGHVREGSSARVGSHPLLLARAGEEECMMLNEKTDNCMRTVFERQPRAYVA